MLCPSCHHDNRDAARVCEQCAAPAAQREMQAARRLYAAMGATAQVERLDSTPEGVTVDG